MTDPRPDPRPAPDELDLTPLMLRFVEEYLVDRNASGAYRRAGGSAKSARTLGPDLLHDPRIAPYIERREREREKETRIRAHRVLEELAVVAFSNHEDYRIDAHGRLKLAPWAPKSAMRAIARVKRKIRRIPQGVDDQGKDRPPIVEMEVEYALWPKTAALTDAMRKLGMFVDRHEVSGPGGAPIPLSRIQVVLVPATSPVSDRVNGRVSDDVTR